MLVATSVATDARVLKEARTLVGAGHRVHIIGKSVPTDFEPPQGITVSSVGASSVLRREGAPSLSRRELSRPVRFARWLMLPTHRQSTFRRWAQQAVEQGAGFDADVVHAHDYTALEAGARLAELKSVPLVYDTHELWSGRPREYRPTPLLDRRERRIEARLGGTAAAVITVGEGVADVLRERYGWRHVVVVRNTFPSPGPQSPRVGAAPSGLIYAGRLAAFRELETVAAASEPITDDLGLPVTLIGPADPTWLAAFDAGRARVLAAIPPEEVDALLAAAGLVLVTHSNAWENHRLALPNKLFQAIRVGAPVIATDVGELAEIVRSHGLGTLYPPGDAAGMVRAVRTAVADYPALCAAVADSAKALSWEGDAAVLLDLYERLTPAAGRDCGSGGAAPQPSRARRSGS